MKEHQIATTREEVRVTVGPNHTRVIPAGSEGTVISVHARGWATFEFPLTTPEDPVIVSLHESQVQDSLRKRRVETAEQWYMKSDLNGDEVEDARGWEDGEPNTLKRTIFVAPAGEEGSTPGQSIAKTLVVHFAPGEADEIVAAYLPGSTAALKHGKDVDGIEVDGSADYKFQTD